MDVRRRSLSEMLDYLAQDVTDHASRYTPATLMVLFSTMADQARELELKVAEYAAAIDDDVDRDDANVLDMRRERDELLNPAQWRDPDERARFSQEVYGD